MPQSKPEPSATARLLSGAGLRPTRQREVVYDVIRETGDHPCAEVVHERAKERFEGISLATVYNCLESFVSAGLVRQLNFQRQPARYCAVVGANPHFAHFHCRRTGEVYDVVLSGEVRAAIERELPDGLRAEQFEINVAGVSAEDSRLSPHVPLSKS
ncbi:MAG: Fur family transcriptional regulator [Puniceicoccaceae bacterium]